jgi:phosphoribosylformylglycinamidine (FGAM) synthase-like enzyme
MADITKPVEPRDSESTDARTDEPGPPQGETLPELVPKVLKKIPIASGHILNVQYDDEQEEMIVEFQNGSRYRYSNVDSHVYAAFMESPSKGNYLHKALRPGVKVVP